MTRRSGRYTEGTNQVWNLARELTKQFGEPYQIDPEHIWLALLKQENSIASKVLREAGMQEDHLYQLIKDYSPPDDTYNVLSTGTSITEWVDLYAEEANSRGHKYIATGHLLLALLKQDHKTTQQILKHFELERTTLSNALGLAFSEWNDYSDHPMLAPPMTLQERIAETFEIAVNSFLWYLEKVLIIFSKKSTINFDRLVGTDRIEVCTNVYWKKIKSITGPDDIKYTIEFMRRQTDGWHIYPFGPPVLQIYLYFYAEDKLIVGVGISWDMLDLFPHSKDLKDHEGKLLFDRLQLNDYVKVRSASPNKSPDASDKSS